MSGSLMSQTAYARARGVDQSTISTAVQTGRIAARGGLIDPELADATWYRAKLSRDEVLAKASEAQARSERAQLTTTIAKLQMTRRRVEQLRARLTERDAGQQKIAAIVAALADRLDLLAQEDGPDAALLGEALALIRIDLGDLAREAQKVTAS